MLKLRAEQLRAFTAARQAAFERQLAEHLWRVWPEQCRRRGEEGVKASIRKAIAKAGSYGITTRYDVERFLDLMYGVDDDFDTHPRVPAWVRQVLSDPHRAPGGKMDLVWSRARRIVGLLARLQARRAEPI